MRTDYLIVSNWKKEGKSRTTEEILLNKTESEANRQAKAFREANPRLKARLVVRSEWVKELGEAS